MTLNLDFLSRYFTEVHFAKNELITRAGEVEHSLYYLSEGIVRFFYYNPTTDKETTVDILFADNVYDYHPIEHKTYLTFFSSYLIDSTILAENYRLYSIYWSSNRHFAKRFHLFQNSFQLEVLFIAPLFLTSWESIKILKPNQNYF